MELEAGGKIDSKAKDTSYGLQALQQKGSWARVQNGCDRPSRGEAGVSIFTPGHCETVAVA